jgi:hypothetical protein
MANWEVSTDDEPSEYGVLNPVPDPRPLQLLAQQFLTMGFGGMPIPAAIPADPISYTPEQEQRMEELRRRNAEEEEQARIEAIHSRRRYLHRLADPDFPFAKLMLSRQALLDTHDLLRIYYEYHPGILTRGKNPDLTRLFHRHDENREVLRHDQWLTNNVTRKRKAELKQFEIENAADLLRERQNPQPAGTWRLTGGKGGMPPRYYFTEDRDE